MKSEPTVVRQAEDELKAKLGMENNFFKAGSYDKLNIDTLRLQTTYDEAKLLFFEASIFRPSFKIEGENILLPVLFFKLDGEDDEFIASLHKYRQKNNKEVLFYSGFHPFNVQTEDYHFHEDTDLFLRDEIKFLSPVKKLHFVNALLELTKWKKDVGISISDSLLWSIALDSKDIISRYHYANAEKTPAKLIVNDIQKNSLTDLSMIRFYLAHLLGLDVCVISKNGYASIENYLSAEEFDHFTVENSTSKPKKGLFAWFKK